MRNNLLCSALIGMLAAATPCALDAQTNGGSTYSILNIGDIRPTVTASSIGRGGIEAATPSSTALNSENPALWSDLRHVTLQAGLSFSQYKVSDASTSLYQNNTKIQNFSVGFPLSEAYGSTLAVGVRPYSMVNYRTQQVRTVPGIDTTTPATITYNGSGGISEAIFGLSFKPVEWVALGVSGSRYFGTIDNRTSVGFSGGSLNPAVYSESDLYRGFGLRGGVQVQPIPALRIAAVYETGSDLDIETHQISAYVDQGQEVVDTTGVTESTLKLPPRLTLGASYRTGRFLVSAEANMQAWGPEQFSTARNAQRFAVGIDRMPSEAMSASGFDRWAFRFGGFYEQTYYDLAAGDINQMGIALGFGVPLTTLTRLNVGTTLDLGLELGIRGTKENNLTQEMFGRLYMELSVSEMWFARTGR